MSQQELSHEARSGRRTFLKVLTTLLGVAAAALVAIPGVGYLVAAVGRRKEPDWIGLGPVSSFPIKETRLTIIPLDENPLAEKWDGVSGKSAVYVRYLGRDDKAKDQFHVFAINCTHLGCPVEWFPQSGLFMCPCHGGVYYEDGERASGPPPRGLYHVVWRVEDGQLEIQAPFLPTLQHTLTGRTGMTG